MNNHSVINILDLLDTVGEDEVKSEPLKKSL